ncbi:hypothetical protein [Leisingera daeponensis]|uniref:hypothetical protein n=1 Tax=Leisingera daeponensis TaxID=405746 RepID=UPI001C958107|nr:hypothetical protein [Leisingera daeponensis]MBY6055369.1 hypothetical protein [Leisingera daeponensis]
MGRLSWALGGAAVLALGVWLVWSHGHRAGEASAIERARVEKEKRQAELFRLADRLSEQAAELERYRNAQTAASQELEEAARADPDNDRPGIGPAGLSRLERRWRSAP